MMCHLILYHNFLSQKTSPLLPSPPEAHLAQGTAGRQCQQGPCLCPQNQHFLLPGLRLPGRAQLGSSQRKGRISFSYMDSSASPLPLLWSSPRARHWRDQILEVQQQEVPRVGSWSLRCPLLCRESRVPAGWGRVVAVATCPVSWRPLERTGPFSLATKWKIDRILQKKFMVKRKLTLHPANFS